MKKTDVNDLFDITKLADLCINNIQKKGFDFWDRFYPTKQDFEKDISLGNHYSFFNSEGLIGCVTVDEEMSVEYLKGEWVYQDFKVIHKLMIDPSRQGKGYSKTGMVLIENMLKEMGIESIRLSVYINNIPANNLYKKLNFKFRGIIELKKGTCYLYEKKI